MKVIGKAKDYYDGFLSWYSDTDNNVFDRDKIFLEKENRPKKNTSRFKIESKDKYNLGRTQQPTHGDFSIDLGRIGFCDRIYPVIRINTFKKKDGSFGSTPLISQDYFYSSEEINLWSENLSQSDLKDFNIMIRKFCSRVYSEDWNASIATKLNTFFLATKSTKLDLSLFEEYPYFVMGLPSFDNMNIQDPRWNSDFTALPVLKEFHFSEVVSPEQAFQEISMFLGRRHEENIDPNSGIEDKYLAAGKGFDCNSFRKRATKKKPKKCKVQK